MKRPAFTLVELLVVIGIVVLLMAILTPMAMKAYDRSLRTRQASDFNTIAIALDAYRADFKSYPKALWYTDATTGVDASNIRGARILCEALVGPGNNDGANGSGFRTTRGGIDDGSAPGSVAGDGIGDGQGAGKVYGPYVDVEKMKVGPVSGGSVLLDQFGGPVLYYPCIQPTPKITIADNYVRAVVGTSARPSTLSPPLINQWDNSGIFNDLPKMRAQLGDTDMNGRIDPGETATVKGPYLLWSAGRDQAFGAKFDAASSSSSDRTKAVAAADDVIHSP